MKVRVFCAGVIISIILLLCDSALILFISIYDGWNELDILSWILIISMLCILPIVLFIFSLLTMANLIEFTEHAVSRIRFGKVIRYFKWEEIQTLDSTEGSTFAGWIYISNKIKKYDYQHVSKMRLDKEVIYFHQSRKALKALQTYAPERFKTQINQWITS